jgi:4-coumarate--CoA ligase
VIIIDPIKERQFTFGQLRTLTQRVAQNLHARLHWQKGDCLAIYAPNCPEYIIAMVGGIAAASTVSPASVSFGVDELTFQLQDSGAKALITHASVLDTALKAATASGIPRSNIFVIPEDPSTSDPAGGVVSFDSLLASNRSTRWVPPSINIRDDLVALPYSSGTTGRPKGVRLSHYNVVSNVFSMAIAWNDGIIDVPPSDDHFISVLPFSHVYGIYVH